jgi:hypothetical protein
MLSPYIHAALAPCLATTRPEPPARSPAAVPCGRPVVLRNGSTVLIRPVHSAGAPLLAGGRGVGVARYIRDADDPQGRALGMELVAQLCQ